MRTGAVLVKSTPWYSTTQFRRLIYDLMVYFLLLVGAIAFLAPFFWMVFGLAIGTVKGLKQAKKGK